jgi:hypothetical protein
LVFFEEGFDVFDCVDDFFEVVAEDFFGEVFGEEVFVEVVFDFVDGVFVAVFDVEFVCFVFFLAFFFVWGAFWVLDENV